MKKYFILLILIISLTVKAFEVKAEEQAINGLIVNPKLIDEQAKFKEIFDYDVVFKNITDKIISIYAVVDDISDEGVVEKYDGPGSTDRTTSLASWITFKRGVIEVKPGEIVTVPLNITISDFAIPGKQYAQIVFPYGSNQKTAAERMASEVFAKIMISVDVQDNVVEKAQIKKFLTTKNIFTSFPVDFVLNINNSGNRAIFPEGNIYIYDRKDREIGQIPVNQDKVKIESGEEADLKPIWSEGANFGKYKAKLELKYGEKDVRDLQDTVFFWVMPLKWLATFGSGLFVFVVVVTFIIFRRTYKRYHPEFSEHEVTPVRQEKSHVIDLKNK